LIANEIERKANLVGHDEFNILVLRVDAMDFSIGNIVDRVLKRIFEINFI
jgi:hypothetical protein